MPEVAEVPEVPEGPEVLAAADVRRLLGAGLDLEVVGVLAGRPLLAVSVPAAGAGPGEPDERAGLAELAGLGPVLGRLPAVVVGVAEGPVGAVRASQVAAGEVSGGGRPGAVPVGFDVLLCDGDDPPAPWVGCSGGTDAALGELAAAVAAQPEAAVVLVELLRAVRSDGASRSGGSGGSWGSRGSRGSWGSWGSWGSRGSDLERGLLAESLAYATLQGGTGFRGWLASRPGVGRGDVTSQSPVRPPARVVRHGNELTVVLDRPEVHNALDTAMRDALVEALAVAGADPEIHTVHLRGAGPSFSSGGDLAEFGSVPDPVTGHLVRMTRSPARAVAAVADRVVAHAHGAVAGAGLELIAFARRVEADPGASFWLPELALGLVPGSGGTVSIPRRIGAARTAWLALTGSRLNAERALAWGLVDAVVPAH